MLTVTNGKCQYNNDNDEDDNGNDNNNDNENNYNKKILCRFINYSLITIPAIFRY